MTNKEAIDIINNRLNTYYCTEEDLQALDLAIKALEEKSSQSDKWYQLKETIIELRDSDGTLNQREVCKFLANLMEILEKE